MIYGLGMLESGITFDYGQLVLDCEFARMIKFSVQGIPVNDETLAVDAIKEIGPGRDFLMHPTTIKGMRKQSRPEMIDRKMRAVWAAAGATRPPPAPVRAADALSPPRLFFLGAVVAAIGLALDV